MAHSRAGLRVPSRLRKCQSHLQIVEDVLGDVAPSVVLPVGVLFAGGHKAARGTYPLGRGERALKPVNLCTCTAPASLAANVWANSRQQTRKVAAGCWNQ